MLADKYEGKPFSGPNDVIVTRDGTIYFSDTTGGIRGRGHDPKEELAPRAIYMIKGGKVTIAIGDIPTPNGLAFSPDEKYLYANGSGANYIRRYEVQSDDTVTNGKLLDRLERGQGERNYRRDAHRRKGKHLVIGSWRRMDYFFGRQTSGHDFRSQRDSWYGAVNVTFGDADYKTLGISLRVRIFTKFEQKFPGITCFNSIKHARRNTLSPTAGSLATL